MDMPLSVLKNFSIDTKKNVVQSIPKEYCPPGYDRNRTKLAISKTSKRDKGNFVHVYYRNNRAKQLIGDINLLEI